MNDEIREIMRMIGHPMGIINTANKKEDVIYECCDIPDVQADENVYKCFECGVIHGDIFITEFFHQKGYQTKEEFEESRKNAKHSYSKKTLEKYLEELESSDRRYYDTYSKEEFNSQKELTRKYKGHAVNSLIEFVIFLIGLDVSTPNILYTNIINELLKDHEKKREMHKIYASYLTCKEIMKIRENQLNIIR